MSRSINQREYKEIYRDKGKSVGEKEVAQMMGTSEMSKEERKQSKLKTKSIAECNRQSGRENPGT